MRGRFRVNITAVIATQRRRDGGQAIMIMRPVNLGVPGIWGVAIESPAITATEDAAIEKAEGMPAADPKRTAARMNRGRDHSFIDRLG
jgi:hypothetical protein